MADELRSNVDGGAAAAVSESNINREVPPCPCCGGSLDIADPRFNFGLPQPVLEMDDDGYERHVRFATDQIVVTDKIGGFARALLPIGLDDGRTTTIGVWISVETEVFKHIVAVGRGELSYDQMQFEGRLASELGPLGSPAPRSRSLRRSRRADERPPTNTTHYEKLQHTTHRRHGATLARSKRADRFHGLGAELRSECADHPPPTLNATHAIRDQT